jgi:uncharacterized protein (DUF305 family)
METKPLLYGLVGFFIGGLLVAIAATTFDKPEPTSNNNDMTMGQMVASLKDKKGHDFDSAFLTEMIAHHKSAVEMAELSAANAEHDEIKALSQDIIDAQEKEIREMRQWQRDWSYLIPLDSSDTGEMSH